MVFTPPHGQKKSPLYHRVSVPSRLCFFVAFPPATTLVVSTGQKLYMKWHSNHLKGFLVLNVPCSLSIISRFGLNNKVHLYIEMGVCVCHTFHSYLEGECVKCVCNVQWLRYFDSKSLCWVVESEKKVHIKGQVGLDCEQKWNTPIKIKTESISLHQNTHASLFRIYFKPWKKF